MSFVLSIVCVTEDRQTYLPISKRLDGLIVEEALQGEDAQYQACYITGLSKYFDKPVPGKGYYVFIDIGEGYLSSSPFFPWPDDDIKPIRLNIGAEYRRSFNDLLITYLKLSSFHRVLILCEWNGNVTSPFRSQEEIELEPVQLSGPFSVKQFWEHHDKGRIFEPSITIIEQEALDLL